jgi:hypothetical protein
MKQAPWSAQRSERSSQARTGQLSDDRHALAVFLLKARTALAADTLKPVTQGAVGMFPTAVAALLLEECTLRHRPERHADLVDLGEVISGDLLHAAFLLGLLLERLQELQQQITNRTGRLKR